MGLKIFLKQEHQVWIGFKADHGCVFLPLMENMYEV